MPLDHIGFTVADFPRSKTFYLAVLEPLGMRVISEGEGWVLLGTDGRAELWLGGGTAPGPVHLAFKAQTREAVQAFHAAALAAGGRRSCQSVACWDAIGHTSGWDAAAGAALALDIVSGSG